MTTYFVDGLNGSDANDGLSEVNAWATIDKAHNTVVAGDLVNIEATATYKETPTIDTVGAANNPIVFRGYTSTVGDGGSITIDGENTRATGLSFSVVSGTHVYYVYENVKWVNHTSHGLGIGGPDYLTFRNCESNDNGGAGWNAGGHIRWERCIASGNAGDGFVCNNAPLGCALFCKAIDNGGDGFQGVPFVIGCLMSGNADTGVLDSTSDGFVIWVGNTVDCADAVGSAGLHQNQPSTTAPPSVVLANNVIVDCATGIIRGIDDGALLVSLNNNLFSNTTNYTNATTHSGEVTGDPKFVNVGGDDYRLGAGSAALAAGVDAGIFVGDNVSYADIGAIQAEGSVASGGGGSGGGLMTGYGSAIVDALTRSASINAGAVDFTLGEDVDGSGVALAPLNRPYVGNKLYPTMVRISLTTPAAVAVTVTLQSGRGSEFDVQLATGTTDATTGDFIYDPQTSQIVILSPRGEYAEADRLVVNVAQNASNTANVQFDFQVIA